ncbi:MAG: hypothetical protein ACPGLV_06890 [Bacteroidia bacterium]
MKHISLALILFCLSFQKTKTFDKSAITAAARLLQLIESKAYSKIDAEFLTKRNYYYKKYAGAPPSIYWDTESSKGIELALGVNHHFLSPNKHDIIQDTTSYICANNGWSKAGVFIDNDPSNFNFDNVMFHRNKYEFENFSDDEIAFAKNVKENGYRIVVTKHDLVFWLIKIEQKWQLYAIDFDLLCGV